MPKKNRHYKYHASIPDPSLKLQSVFATFSFQKRVVDSSSYRYTDPTLEEESMIGPEGSSCLTLGFQPSSEQVIPILSSPLHSVCKTTTKFMTVLHILSWAKTKISNESLGNLPKSFTIFHPKVFLLFRSHVCSTRVR